MSNLHFVLFPLMAQGHVIPMVDIARILAQRGALVTIVTTPLIATRYRSVIARATEAKLKIQLLELELPLAEVGLPQEYESLDRVPSSEVKVKLFTAIDLLEQPAEDLLRGLCPPPSCIISDVPFAWTTNVARRFNILRLVFQGPGCFYLMCKHIVSTTNMLDRIESDSERFVLPSLPDRVEVTKPKLSGTSKVISPNEKGFRERFEEAEKAAYGIVVQSFNELEPKYVKELEKVNDNKVWCIGPVSLCNKDNMNIAERGNKAAISEHDCLKWLDEKKPGSVLFICLGSLAPQMLILSHRSVGGFLSHCGWNSTLEAICARVPIITWPLFADQFLNEILIVEILKIGVKDGVEVPVSFEEDDKVSALVNREDVTTAVALLMNEDEEGKQRRKNVTELAEMAKRATDEGGSSFVNVSSLVQDIADGLTKNLRPSN